MIFAQPATQGDNYDRNVSKQGLFPRILASEQINGIIGTCLRLFHVPAQPIKLVFAFFVFPAVGDQGHRGRLPAARAGQLPDTFAPVDARLLAEGKNGETHL